MPIKPNSNATSETDPVYTADKPNIALKSEIPDISNLATKTEVQNAKSLAIAMAIAL